jgi:hypothetical protein
MSTSEIWCEILEHCTWPVDLVLGSRFQLCCSLTEPPERGFLCLWFQPFSPLSPYSWASILMGPGFPLSLPSGHGNLQSQVCSSASLQRPALCCLRLAPDLQFACWGSSSSLVPSHSSPLGQQRPRRACPWVWREEEIGFRVKAHRHNSDCPLSACFPPSCLCHELAPHAAETRAVNRASSTGNLWHLELCHSELKGPKRPLSTIP